MRSRDLALALALATLVAGAFLTFSPETVAELDRKRARYLENGASGRTIAALETALVRNGARAELEVRISAFGPLVDPVPGYEGIQGANRLTAREIDGILRENRMTVRTSRPGLAGTQVRGTHRGGRRGPVPARRVRDGRIVWDGLTDEEYTLELFVSSGPVVPGKHVTEVVVDGRRRLRIAFEFDGSAGRIVSIESLDEHPLRIVH